MGATPQLLLVVHLGVTWFMTGVIWIVQVVHYPLFGRVGAAGYEVYQADHVRLISYVVLPAMLVELATACVLAWQSPTLCSPSHVSARTLWVANLVLLAVIWSSTFLVQVPAHEQLAGGFDADAHRRLVSSNWIRTVAWSLRAFGLAALLYAGLRRCAGAVG